MTFNIVLVAPEIPQNTGNIGRICVDAGCRLHLIEPLGFVIDDKHLKRAGMDYWQHLDYVRYANFDEFLAQNPNACLRFFTTKGHVAYWDVDYPDNVYLVFGSESHGLPPDFYARYQRSLVTIPMPGTHSRSLNLANSVAIAAMEVLRQNR